MGLEVDEKGNYLVFDQEAALIVAEEIKAHQARKKDLKETKC